jgi:hypothetical protein
MINYSIFKNYSLNKLFEFLIIFCPISALKMVHIHVDTSNIVYYIF